MTRVGVHHKNDTHKEDYQSEYGLPQSFVVLTLKKKNPKYFLSEGTPSQNLKKSHQLKVQVTLRLKEVERNSFIKHYEISTRKGKMNLSDFLGSFIFVIVN